MCSRMTATVIRQPSSSPQVHDEVVGGFQAVHCGHNTYERRNIPVRIRVAGGIAPHNQEVQGEGAGEGEGEGKHIVRKIRFCILEPLHYLITSEHAFERNVYKLVSFYG